MALEAPAARMRCTGLDEEREVVEPRISPAEESAHRSFDLLKDAFELDDAVREPGAALAQPGAQHRERRRTLLGVHLSQRKTASLLRHVRPPGTLRVVERKRGAG